MEHRNGDSLPTDSPADTPVNNDGDHSADETVGQENEMPFETSPELVVIPDSPEDAETVGVVNCFNMYGHFFLSRKICFSDKLYILDLIINCVYTLRRMK